MTESELCGSSFDWEGGSPSVFFRPMNPALSAQHYFPEDSPVLIDSKDNYKRNGMYLTPASPLFGSVSYMSQESSCCSALNNAVILEDDDNETIPTDERPNLVPLAAEDVSPIVDMSFNVSDVPGAGASFPPVAVSEDRSNSSLQDLLFNPQPGPVDTAFIGNSPGPQWSPGIRSSLKSPTVIRIESTLNYFEGIPSASPKKAGGDSSMSLSAIFPSVPTAVPNETRSGCGVSSILQTPAKPNFNLSEDGDEASAGLSNDVRLAPPVPVPEPVHHFSSGEPSPVRKLTHCRSIAGSRVSLPSLRLPPRESSFYYEHDTTRQGQDVTRSFNLSANRRKIVLSSEERELKEAEEGRRRLMEQIRSNRSHVELSVSGSASRSNRSHVELAASGSASARLSARLAENRARLPRVDLTSTSSTYLPFSASRLTPTNSASRANGTSRIGHDSGLYGDSVLGSFLAASRPRSGSSTPSRFLSERVQSAPRSSRSGSSTPSRIFSDRLQSAPRSSSSARSSPRVLSVPRPYGVSVPRSAPMRMGPGSIYSSHRRGTSPAAVRPAWR